MSVRSALQVHCLPALGRALPADQDHCLTRTSPGALLLIHVPPGAYAFEQHVADEWIVCVSGRLVMETADGGRATANAGDLLHVPAGLAHRFAQDADAVVLTLSQAAEAPPWNRA